MNTAPKTHGCSAARRLLPLAMMAFTWAGAATAGSLGYTPGGLPDLTGFREGAATFDDVAQQLGSPEQLNTNAHNQVASASWWLPAQGYAAPASMIATTPPSATQKVAGAAASGFFSRLKGQAIGMAGSVVPGVGGVAAAQALAAAPSGSEIVSANAIQASAIPGWQCQFFFLSEGARLTSASCSKHDYLPRR